MSSESSKLSSQDSDVLLSQKITLKLIIKRNVASESTDRDTVHSLLRLTHVHLDRSRIDEIDNLAEYLNNTGLTHLYLHHNRIGRIENLDFLVNLTYLNLSNNLIERVQSLKHLKRLQLLDMSSNRIDQPMDQIVVSNHSFCTFSITCFEIIISIVP